MKWRLSIHRILEDDRAQALTEFVMVFPIILFLFCAILQYLIIVRVSQLGNYARYYAARVYAVRLSVDGKDEATKAAIRAAAFAYAPVARQVPELGIRFMTEIG